MSCCYADKARVMGRGSMTLLLTAVVTMVEMLNNDSDTILDSGMDVGISIKLTEPFRSETLIVMT